ncbi:MAG: EAL domain-containing protein [Pseudomonadales bacterium]|nr:EAL domain-containing protein [Pseudomonadales bacterium]
MSEPHTNQTHTLLDAGRTDVVVRSQIDQLFAALKTSAPMGIFAAVMVLFVVAGTSPLPHGFGWLAVMISIYAYRWVLGVVYLNKPAELRQHKHWLAHFEIASYLAALGWASSLYLIYPVDEPGKILLVLCMLGIASVSAASLASVQRILICYQGIITSAVIIRMLTAEESWALPLLVSYVIFSCVSVLSSRRNATMLSELVGLRFDAEHDLFQILSATEKAAGVGYFRWNPSEEDFQLSRNLQRIFQLDDQQVPAEQVWDNLEESETARLKAVAAEVMKTGEECRTDFRFKDQTNNHWQTYNVVINRIVDASGNYLLLGTFLDVSQIRLAEEKIYDMAYFDELTGLANRAHLRQHLSQELSHAARNSLQMAVFFIDLDGFKEINDTLGHEAGDEYLKEFSRRLLQVVRADDFVARLGGDEFCIVLNDLEEGTAVARAAERCLNMNNTPIRLGNQDCSPRLSIGIAVYPDDGQDFNSLLRAADTAMYSAKQSGKHCFAFYDAEMTREAEERFQMEADLKVALSEQQFELWYQPKVCLKTGDLVGVEALIRWFHPKKGQIRPDQFIPAAERVGLINDIGIWVLEEAAAQSRQWKDAGLQLVTAINISSSHFSSPGFSDKVTEVVEKYCLESGDLEIEITESLSRDPLQHTEVSQRLRQAGQRVAIDDFGTGYSSLSVLIQLEADTLKVDRSFINDLSSDSASALMVSAILSIGLGLGYEIVAEGVETREQVEFLSSWGCPYAQGYLFSPPVPAAAIPAMVVEGFAVFRSDDEHKQVTLFS